MRHLILALALLTGFAVAISPRSALANDFSFGGAGSDIVPVKETRVRMASEDVVATYVRPESLPGQAPGRSSMSFWRVSATYVFENPTSEVISLQMGFPEATCSGADSDCHITAPFQEMRTTVRGVTVRLRKGEVSLNEQFAGLGTIWQYDVRFLPRENVTVRHTYRIDATYNLEGGQELKYVTKTGALWAGPIGHARFRFRISPWMRELEHTKDPAPKRISVVRVAGRDHTEVIFEEQDWNPQNDLYVAFTPYQGWLVGYSWVPPGSAEPGVESCSLDIGLAYVHAVDAQNKGRTAVDELVTEWSKMSRGALRTCRNAVFAAYGRKFQDTRLNRLFYGPDGWKPGQPPYGFLEPNPLFSPRLLYESDWTLLRLLSDAINRAQPRTENQ
jgi:hypothetical protein